MKETFLDRLEKERYELETKIIGLEKFFIGSKKFEKIPEIQKILLGIQLDTMKTYLTILESRLIELKK